MKTTPDTKQGDSVKILATTNTTEVKNLDGIEVSDQKMKLHQIHLHTNRQICVLVDEEDLEFLKRFRWHLSGGKYVSASIDGREVYLHRLLLNPERGKVVDHINSNTFDNRRANLRICFQGENTKNCSTPKNNTSGYKGVTFHKQIKRWIAHIRVEGRNIHIGTFTDPVEAAKRYDDAAREYFGQFAKPNFK